MMLRVNEERNEVRDERKKIEVKERKKTGRKQREKEESEA